MKLNENQPWYTHIAALISQGCTLSQAVDYLAVEHEGVPPAVWSGMRGTKTDRVASVSIQGAKKALGEIDDQPKQTELEP